MTLFIGVFYCQQILIRHIDLFIIYSRGDVVGGLPPPPQIPLHHSQHAVGKAFIICGGPPHHIRRTPLVGEHGVLGLISRSCKFLQIQAPMSTAPTAHSSQKRWQVFFKFQSFRLCHLGDLPGSPTENAWLMGRGIFS